jgi:hypothetical protein
MTIRYRQNLLAVTTFIIVAACVVAFSFGKRKNRSTTMTIHVKSISDPEILILTPSDRRFDLKLESTLGKKESDIRELIESGKPFCVFVQNSTDISVVGLALEWRVMHTDGTTESRGQGYSTPGALTGLTVLDPAMIGHTDLISPHSTSFISLDPDLKQIFDSRHGLISDPAVHNDNEQLQAYGQSLRGEYKQLLATSQEVDISVDGVIFSDGSYRGLDKYQVILSTHALVQAKKDLSERVEHAIRNKESLAKLFQTLKQDTAAFGRPPRNVPNTFASRNSDYDRLYRNYLEIYTDELVGIVKARGPAEAIKYSQEAYQRPWPSLHARKL